MTHAEVVQANLAQQLRRRAMRRFLPVPEPLTDFGAFPALKTTDSLPARIQRIWSPTYRTLIRFEWAAWNDGHYAPKFEDLNRADAARMLREMRQRVKDGGKLIKTADGFYCEVAE